ncbi:unnamed protein product [Linum tenue]|uniref:Uncharacterized protein n=1 Tax=Linum tenue TaxID=586396 RepID=A0AAV0K4P2_9ROSI|nr:unnamed protein product [Linum tenue]
MANAPGASAGRAGGAEERDEAAPAEHEALHRRGNGRHPFPRPGTARAAARTLRCQDPRPQESAPGAGGCSRSRSQADGAPSAAANYAAATRAVPVLRRRAQQCPPALHHSSPLQPLPSPARPAQPAPSSS